MNHQHEEFSLLEHLHPDLSSSFPSVLTLVTFIYTVDCIGSCAQGCHLVSLFQCFKEFCKEGDCRVGLISTGLQGNVWNMSSAEAKTNLDVISSHVGTLLYMTGDFPTVCLATFSFPRCLGTLKILFPHPFSLLSP